MKWMEPFLESGNMAGKITCPNKKCGAKLGNYDWAGVCCSCKEWVVPVRVAVLLFQIPRGLSVGRTGILHSPVQGRRGRVGKEH